MSIDDERKNQENEPIAARASTQPRRRGPMGRGGMMPGEKAGDFKGSMLKLLAFMGKFKFALGAVFAFAIASTVFNIVGPKVLSTATTELFEGVTAENRRYGRYSFRCGRHYPANNPCALWFFRPVLICPRLAG